MNQLRQHIEALIFCSDQSISLSEISASLKITFGWEVEEQEILNAIEEIKAKYQSEDFSFELLEIADGYQFLTKKEFHSTISALIQHKAKKKLSVAQMETLAIIAYKQPVSKTDVEHIRGVNCDYAVQKLLEKELIEIQGKSDGPGRPIIYRTSESFMDYFGIKSVKDLPQLKDIHPEQNEIGTSNEMMDVENEISESTESVSETIEMISESSEIVAENISEEKIIVTENPEASELPDRKSIFLSHEQETEKSDDVNSEIPRDENGS